MRFVSSKMLPLLSASNFQDTRLSMSKSCLFIAADWTTSSLFFSANSGISSSTCGASKVQVGLQLGVSRGGGRGVWRSTRSCVSRGVVSEFGPLRGPRCRDRRDARSHSARSEARSGVTTLSDAVDAKIS